MVLNTLAQSILPCFSGVTPAEYETDRSDGSMQAATAPACHQIRESIQKLGLLNAKTESSGKTSASEDDAEKKVDEANKQISKWVEYYLKDDFKKTICCA